ncbi:MAG: DUF4910 domain-containing protein [Pirellulales bacterium]
MTKVEGIDGCELFELMERLYPICRSITGDGVRHTLEILRQMVPLEVHEVPSGTQVLDWTVPDEWNIRDAWIKDSSGRRVVDFCESNLHVVNYSEPVRQRISKDELQQHLHSLPEHPDWIPYRTSYYARTWGFCLSENQRQELTEDEYEVCIDSHLAPGKLTYGELFLPGERSEEILFSSHICHPSLANDNLSGIVLAVFLARHLAGVPRRWSYRFLFAPGTIGAITWLAKNRETATRIKGGLTLVCLGDREGLTYKRTFAGNEEIDRIVKQALYDTEKSHEIIDFFPDGYDERQYNSPGFRLPIGSLMRGRHGQFPEYHTSADNLNFVSPDQLLASWECLHRIIFILENNQHYRNRFPYGEPQLGKKGVYQKIEAGNQELKLAILWVLNLADGKHSLLDTAERSKLPYRLIQNAADILLRQGLLEKLTPI